MNSDKQHDGELFIEPQQPQESKAEQQPVIRDKQEDAGSGAGAAALAGRSCGSVLRREREKRGMTPQEVYQAVRIKPERIIALENEDFDALPEPIYIMAYIKRLCEFYHVKSSLEKELLESLDLHKTVEIPEDFSKTLKGFSLDEENAKRERRMIFIAIFLILAVLILIGAGITLAVIHLNAPPKQPLPDGVSAEEMLIKLQPVPKLKMTEL